MTRPDRPVPIGRFDLREIVAGGATATIWRGEHRNTGTSVAVKILEPETLEQIGGMPGFRRSVQAQARLTHPGIASVFDYGTVSPTAADRSDGRIQENAPYLVMEFAEEGTLAGTILPQDFAWIREILLGVLWSLGHAHARDIVHRDLKPANILRFPDHPGAARWKLTDFGFAIEMRDIELDEIPGPAANAGTPHYMAPEQLDGNRRCFGPWTDLYQVGCMAYELVCGTTPYQGESFAEIATGHLYESPPDLEPRFAVPEGFEAWIHRLMAEDPADRFRRAADAARRLDALPIPDSSESGAFDPPAFGAELIEEHRPESILEAPLTNRAPSEAPFPDHLKRPETRADATRFSDVGLALVGLRERTLADREDAYERIWSALETVVATGETRCLVVDAPSGLGKTHLVQSFARRVDELGICTVLEVNHDRGSGSNTDLSGLIESWARTRGVDLRRAEELIDFHLRRHVADRSRRAELVSGLTRLLDPAAGGGESERPGADAADERFALVEQFLGRLAEDRPLLVMLDDLHCGPESAAFVEWLLDRYDSPPVLIAATCGDEAAVDSESTRRRLERIRDHRSADRIELGPLDRPAQYDLVDFLLPLTRDVVEHVVERSEGHPLFAIQLVQDWVDRDLLARTDRGFAFPDDGPPEIGGSLVDLWIQRVRAALEALPEADRDAGMEALEVAAVLGRRFADEELRRALAADGLPYPEKLFERVLIDRGLLERELEDRRFSHRLLVESLVAHADRAGRLATHHRRCADAIAAARTDGSPADAVRLARHLRASDQTEAALEPMMEAARAYRLRAGLYDRAHELLEEHAEWMDDCRLPETDPRRLANWLERGWTLIHRGEPHLVRDLVERAASVAEQTDRTAEAGEAQLLMARVAYDRGKVEEVDLHLRSAEGSFRALEDAEGMTRCLRFRAELARRQQRHEDARALLENVRRRYASRNHPVGRAWCDWGIARSWLNEGDVDRAESVVRELADEIESLDAPHVSAAVHNTLGDIARSRRDWEAAIDHYERARTLWRQAGSKDHLVPELNVGLAQIEAREWEAAEETLGALRYRLEVAGLQALRPHITFGLAACAAHRRDWVTVREHIESMTPADEAVPEPDPDLVNLAEAAAQQCREGGEVELADRFSEVEDFLSNASTPGTA